ncbi:MAG: glycerophosphodiester phosphodiesterase [Acidimicrobiales bacterium]|nr:glycerophosphodiester phosphodiesterase [Acidimicrobiales bacterium]MCB9393942.1 glycerophosphodiester phosphodiesterase [Acidimicrobiaceae bacterium]
MPPVTHAFLDWDGPIPFAHRGGASDAPENTMPAFEDAVALGFRHLETDVQVTADGVLVAFHDDDLQRTCGRPGRISQLPWHEVREARVGGVAPIPLLDDLLGAWDDVRINIDCKADAAERALVSTLRRHRALHRVCVGAFSDVRIARLRAALGAELCTALGPRHVALLKFGRLGRPKRLPGLVAQVPVRQGRLTVTDERFVERAHALGIHVHVWTIDDPAEMERLLDLGVDGLMTDRPAVLREVLRRREHWRD